MKVQSIYNNNIININAPKSIKFRGATNNNPDLAQKFQYGLEALNDNTLLLVATDEIKAKQYLNNFSSKINIPIVNLYILKADELKDTNFALFKKDDEYFCLNLNGNNGMGFKTSDLITVSPGDIMKVNQEKGYFMTHELVELFEKNPLFFNPPYKYNPDNAKKYLEYRTTLNDLSGINQSTIKKLTIHKTEKTNKAKSFSFADIGGLDNIIEELRKFVLRPIMYPEVFENIRLNKGILLYGPPRCGKTLLGKALANEAGIQYWYKNANEFKFGIVGDSEKSVREYFSKIMKEPGILFIDEFDAIAKQREGSQTSRHEDSLVNQILGSMSDLEKSNINSFVIAATNRKDLLDSAMTASGRFGLHLEIPMPDEEALTSIYKIHSKNKPFDKDVNIQELVKLMKENEFNGSDVAEMITTGYFNALDRLGMNRKMDARIFSSNDLKIISIARIDLLSALKKIAEQKIAR